MKNEILKTAREQSSKTQMEVASETNLNVCTYQKYEAGTATKTIQTTIRIAKAVGSTVEQLWGNKPEETTV